ncbi:hypothetical protein K505DRAFT_332375 [Melanomma pulvis-pyrius CBS 109.77]|uniref:Uncharacterized protein n=1 Tax=Melanomma pulvis-pyrius CBS 109.77 TaxID=1314802 RepID=A0A6A6XVU4_9PLEO|nr:hypothetical protein K505DRAFT_332375 [Melanomma pulvis-pyrius CBS 109.77]
MPVSQSSRYGDAHNVSITQSPRALTIRSTSPHTPFIHRKLKYPCGCLQRVHDLPKDQSDNASATFVTPSSMTGGLTKGLHIDAEFIYEDSSISWDYKPQMGDSEHHSNCELHDPWSNFKGHGEFGPMCRGMHIKTFLACRCGFQQGLEKLPNAGSLPCTVSTHGDTDSIFEPPFSDLISEYWPTRKERGLHLDAEFCYARVEFKGASCPTCVLELDTVRRQVEVMRLGEVRKYNEVRWNEVRRVIYNFVLDWNRRQKLGGCKRSRR